MTRTFSVGHSTMGTPLTINGEPLATEDINGVEAFDVGRWNGDTYTDTQLDELVENTNLLIAEGLLEPPVKIGHADDQSFLEREGYPAAGWVTSVYRQGTKVMVNLAHVPQKVAALVKSGAYRKVSSEIWRAFGKAPDGKTYGHVLKAIAFLGEEIPAVASLDDIVGLYEMRPSDLRMANALTYAADKKAEGVINFTVAPSDSDTDAIAETLADQFERLATTVKDSTKGKIGAPRMRAFLTETARALRALMGGDAQKHEDDRAAETFALTHNDKTKGGEPPWSEVDKTTLPRNAFADEGTPDEKSTWKYPHHWVSGGDEYLHLGGLRAALSAAGGGRSGHDASSTVTAHLDKHARAVGMGNHAQKEGADMEPKVIAKALGLAEDASEADILAAATANTEKAGKFVEAEKEVSAFKEKEATAAATAIVEQAVKDKKVAPAQKEWASKFARKDPEGFKEFLASAPAIFAAPKGHEGTGPQDDTDARATLNRLVTEKMNASNGALSYTDALREVSAANRDLARAAADATRATN